VDAVHNEETMYGTFVRAQTDANPLFLSGYICISLPEERLNQLDIPMMVPDNQERHKTAYTVTVDAKEGNTTSHAPMVTM
jgi:3,4-dihydroxy-2-butanone 4-phosphate synthase